MQMIFAPSMSTHNKQGRGMAGGVESALHSTRFATSKTLDASAVRLPVAH